MKLSDDLLENKSLLISKGYTIPGFNRKSVKENTMREPVWLHFGAGNIFRAFPAVLQQQLIEQGLQDKGIIVAEGYDYEIIDAAYKPFDDLSVSVTLLPDGNVTKTIVGSVAESVKFDDSGKLRLLEIFESKSLQIVSLTITEKGYNISQSDGTYFDLVNNDFENGPNRAVTFLGRLTALCLHRYNSGAYPLALVSMDNCSKNGILLHKSVSAYAGQWIKNGFADEGFKDYTDNPLLLSFPCTMIDKITPYPSVDTAKLLADDGLENMTIITTAKKTVTAAFVNSEAPEYLVAEDVFPNGRPPLERVGVLFTDRETVDKAEKMKVCTCLNPLHTALSVFACVLGYTRISDAMKDPDLLRLTQLVAKEGLPVAVDPGIISPQEFADTVINVRLPNPFIPDTPQRIATDTSRKLAVRFGETIKTYAENSTMDIGTLRAIPLVLAGWCRYLTGTDDEGNAFTLSPDPMLTQLQDLLANVKIGENIDCDSILYPILSDSGIFGVNLYNIGLADKVISDFKNMITGKGAVRRALQELKTGK